MNINMDERTVRAQLVEVKKYLAENEAEREVLLNLLRGYEGWLRLYGTKSIESVRQLPLSKSPDDRVKNPMGFARTVIKVLQDAHGEPIHSEEIWRRMQAAGFVSKAKDPAGWVDFAARNNGAVKVEPRTWRWENGNT
ncbi:MAG: hypothetical protein KKF26_05155 [Chloroflexi bacterium]|nr:hypothetical protein [Chloroflexota bacterium]